MRKRFPLALIAIAGMVLLAGIIFLVYPRREAKPMAAELASASVAAVQRGSISHVLTLAGQFQPYQVIDVHPKVSGFIRHIYVDIGDRVHQGEILAVLEVPELAAQLKETQAAVARSRDEIVRAQHEIARTEAEYAALHLDNTRLQATAKAQPGLIAQQELDDALAKDLASQAQVDAAKSALAVAQGGAAVASANSDRVAAIQAYTDVVAPLDGVIIWRYADTGALIQSGTGSNDQALPIVRLSESGLLRLRMPVPEDAVSHVKVGDPMQIQVGALGRSLTGKVVRFTRSVNFETRTMQTEVDVENKDLSISPGMYANAQLELNRVTNVLTIPVEALVLMGNREMVYAVDAGGRVHQQAVQVGLEGTKLAEITSGLAEGDRVIAGGQEKYQNGEQIHPIAVAQPTYDVTQTPGGTIDLQGDQKGAQ